MIESTETVALREALLKKTLLELVTEQSAGEWSDAAIAEDVELYFNKLKSGYTDATARQRIDELLGANTKYLLRARKSEGLLRDLIDSIRGDVPTRLHADIDEYLKAPWNG